MIEKLDAQFSAGAALVHRAMLAEQLGGPHFFYDFTCSGPRDGDRARLVEIRREIQHEISHALDGDFRPLTLLDLRREEAAIPLEVKWRDGFRNTIMTAGKNDLLDKYFAGSAYTATWYLGLVALASYTAIAAADTMASHAGWTESSAYSNANRVTLAFAAASAGSKATSSAASFNINATDTIKGGFVVANNTKAGTTGVLYSTGLFGGGDRAVLNGDTLNVSLTQSV